MLIPLLLCPFLVHLYPYALSLFLFHYLQAQICFISSFILFFQIFHFFLCPFCRRKKILPPLALKSLYVTHFMFFFSFYSFKLAKWLLSWIMFFVVRNWMNRGPSCLIEFKDSNRWIWTIFCFNFCFFVFNLIVIKWMFVCFLGFAKLEIEIRHSSQDLSRCEFLGSLS